MSGYAILITAHNEEHYLGKALDAIKCQEGLSHNPEIVVVDNASTDKTSEIAKEYEVTVVHERKKGIPYALKAGYDYIISQGYEWVIQTDADSVVEPYWISSVLENIEDPSVVGFTGPTYFYDTPLWVKWFSRNAFAGFIWVQKTLTGTTQLIGSNMAMKMAAYQDIGGVDLNFLVSADVNLSKRLQRVGKITYLSGMVVGVSARRFKKQPLKALFMYARGFGDAIRGKSSTIELDDVR